MPLLKKIESDIKSAQKTQAAERLSTLRLVLAQIQNRRIELRRDLEDAEVEQVLQREIKKRKEASQLYEQGNRPELAKKENEEIKVIGEYLPPPITPAAIEYAVKEIISSGEKDFGKVMRLVKDKLGGGVDGKELSEVVKKALV